MFIGKQRTRHEKTKTERIFIFIYRDMYKQIFVNLFRRMLIYKHIDQRAKERKIVHHHEERRAYNNVDQCVKN